MGKCTKNGFWSEEILANVMKFYIAGPLCYHNFFTFLVYDWYETSEKYQKFYFLATKYNASRNGPNKPVLLINFLYSSLNNEDLTEWHQVILKVLYYLYKQTSNCDMNGIIKFHIQMALMIQNKYMRRQVLKILSIRLENTDDEKYHNIKALIFQKLESDSEYNTEYESMINASYRMLEEKCDVEFLKFIFHMKENTALNEEFAKLINVYKTCFGESWQAAYTFNAQLICLNKKDKNFVVVEALNQMLWKADKKMSNFNNNEKLSEFQTIFIKSLKDEARKLKVRIRKYRPISSATLGYLIYPPPGAPNARVGGLP